MSVQAGLSPLAGGEVAPSAGGEGRPDYLVGSSKNMTGGLFTSSSAMASRFRWPPERLPVRVLAQDRRPRAVRISLTWGTAEAEWHQRPPATPRHLQAHMEP